MRQVGLVQRSVWLSREMWSALRTLRLPTETSDSETLARVLREAMP